MRILQVARYASVTGGTEAYVRELCAGLRSAGHDVALAYRFDPDDTRPEVKAGMQLGAITSRNAAPTQTERNEVRRAVASFRPDVIHVHNVDPPWLPSLLNGLAPTVHGVHDHRLDCPTGTRYLAGWGRACEVAPGGKCLGYNLAAHCGSLRANATLEPYRRWRRAHRAAQRGPAIQVFSDYMRGEIERAGITTPVTVTPYPAPQPAAVKAGIVDIDKRPVVFASGRLTKEKGFDLLLDALDRLAPATHVVIGGTGHHEAALIERAKAVPSRHGVTFTGWLDRETIAAWYGRATVFAMPSAWPEPFGIVGLEAMSAGLPVVATDVGGVRQWLVDGVTGIAVPPRDPGAFAGALHCLLADATLRRTMGAAGRERVMKEFSLERHVASVLEMYEQARRGREVAA
jgi:glycosyltransferase involved in cell wall biosynthesis